MNRKEFGSFSHFQILTKMAYAQQKSSNSLILKFVFIHCKAVKVGQDDQIRM